MVKVSASGSSWAPGVETDFRIIPSTQLDHTTAPSCAIRNLRSFFPFKLQYTSECIITKSMLAMALISTSHNALLLLKVVTLASPSHAPRSRFIANESLHRSGYFPPFGAVSQAHYEALHRLLPLGASRVAQSTTAASSLASSVSRRATRLLGGGFSHSSSTHDQAQRGEERRTL